MFRILVIDDSKAVQAYVKSCFSGIGKVQLTSALNGEAGLEILKSDSDFQLVLLDWEMPVMDGPTTVPQILNLNISCPVIMMTSRNAPEDIKKMLAAGVSEYIMKPFTKDILFGKIDGVTGWGFENVS